MHTVVAYAACSETSLPAIIAQVKCYRVLGG